MVKKISIFASALFLAVTLTNLSDVFASDNSIVRIDINKFSDSAINMTFHTSEAFNDNVVVRKKSDNKYVILLPKVINQGSSVPDFSSVKDIVSNVDVKSINESGNAYTKVTLITKRPVNIQTNTVKSGGTSSEQLEYQSVLAKANSISTPPSAVKQTETAPSKNIEQPKQEPKKEIKSSEPTPTALKTGNKPEIQKTEEKIKNKTEEISKKLNIKKENENNDLKKIVPETTAAAKPQIKKEVSHPAKTKISFKKQLKSKLPSIRIKNPLKSNFYAKHKLPGRKTAMFMLILIPLLGIVSMIKLIKNSVVNSHLLKESFKTHLDETPHKTNKSDYKNIINDKKLNWQERYRKYLDASAQPVSRGSEKGNYVFIKQPANEKEIIEQKRQSLEKLIQPEVELPKNEIPAESNITEPKVLREEDFIRRQLHKNIKLKGFANSPENSLNMSGRDKIKSRFKKYEEQTKITPKKNVELDISELNANARVMKNSNLDISEIQALKKRAKEMNIDENDYIMSSVEEYLSILDKEKSTKSSIIPNMKNIRMISKNKSEYLDSSEAVNPISSKNATKRVINGLVVKSGYNIDENRGFYIVNLDGESALIGCIKDEIFILKKFDNDTDKLQVRKDNGNVYMVKTDGFKSLVEVGEDKMGVLIEL